MATIGDLLLRKGNQVHRIGPEATVFAATQLMNRIKIGALVVTDQDRLVGIFTERDVLRRVVAEGRDPAATRVEDVMTTELACARRDTTLDEASVVMKNRHIRHLPVCDDEGQLAGLISIGDLNAWEADGHETTIHFLNEYIHGRM